ncbi:MAG TPA: SAM-dependent methyltransferase, partial [Streptosporangiales bacterium]
DHLDLDRPIALFQCATLHFVPDQNAAEQIIRGYVERLAPGSYVGITHGRLPDPSEDGYEQMTSAETRFASFAPAFTPRTEDAIRSLFDGLELVPPGVVPLDDWWPSGPRLEPPSPLARMIYGGLARKG